MRASCCNGCTLYLLQHVCLQYATLVKVKTLHLTPVVLYTLAICNSCESPSVTPYTSCIMYSRSMQFLWKTNVTSYYVYQLQVTTCMLALCNSLKVRTLHPTPVASCMLVVFNSCENPNIAIVFETHLLPIYVSDILNKDKRNINL